MKPDNKNKKYLVSLSGKRHNIVMHAEKSYLLIPFAHLRRLRCNSKLL
jgi:hypothetical protein